MIDVWIENAGDDVKPLIDQQEEMSIVGCRDSVRSMPPVSVVPDPGGGGEGYTPRSSFAIVLGGRA